MAPPTIAFFKQSQNVSEMPKNQPIKASLAEGFRVFRVFRILDSLTDLTSEEAALWNRLIAPKDVFENIQQGLLAALNENKPLEGGETKKRLRESGLRERLKAGLDVPENIQQGLSAALNENKPLEGGETKKRLRESGLRERLKAGLDVPENIQQGLSAAFNEGKPLVMREGGISRMMDMMERNMMAGKVMDMMEMMEMREIEVSEMREGEIMVSEGLRVSLGESLSAHGLEWMLPRQIQGTGRS